MAEMEKQVLIGDMTLFNDNQALSQNIAELQQTAIESQKSMMEGGLVHTILERRVRIIDPETGERELIALVPLSSPTLNPRCTSPRMSSILILTTISPIYSLALVLSLKARKTSMNRTECFLMRKPERPLFLVHPGILENLLHSQTSTQTILESRRCSVN